MIEILDNVSFDSFDLDASCVTGLLQAKSRASMILQDHPEVQADTIAYFNKLTVLPDLGELGYMMSVGHVWLACAIKALIEAGTTNPTLGVYLERYAHTGLSHAGRIFKYEQGIEQGKEQGVKVQVEKAAAQRKVYLQQALKAKAVNVEASRKKIIECHDKIIAEKGNFWGIGKAVADACGVTPAYVSKTLGKRHLTKGKGEC